MLVDHHTLSLLFTGFKTLFRKGEELAQPKYRSVAMEVPSSTTTEQYSWLGAALGMHEWVDDRTIESIGSHKFEIANRDWEQTIGVDRNKIEDDTFAHYAMLFERMGAAAALHPDELTFSLFNDGETGLCYDGQPFFSTAHPCLRNPVPEGHPGTQSNLHDDAEGPPWYLLDLSSTLKPMIFQTRKARQFVAKHALTDDNVFHRRQFLYGVDARYNAGYGMWQYAFRSTRTLNEANVEAAITAMRGLFADNGKPMNISPTAIMVPTTLDFQARKIFSRDFIAESSAGVSNIHRGTMEILTIPHLTRS